MNTAAGNFVAPREQKGEFRSALKAGNGETIAISEGYASKSDVQNGIGSLRKNAADSVVIDES